MASSEIVEFPPGEYAGLGEPAGVPDRAGDSPEPGGAPEAQRRTSGGGWLRSVAVERAAVAVVLVLAIAVRLGPLQRGLGFDELFTAMHFVQTETVWQTATTSVNFNNHVASSLLARLSVGLFGPSEWALRLPALLLGLASLAVLWRLARALAGPGIALAAMSLMALSPEHVHWSTTARGYSGLLLGVLASSGLLFALLARPSLLAAALLALAVAASAYFHLYAVPVALVQGLFVLGWLARRRHALGSRRGGWLALGGLLAGGALTILLYLPILAPLVASTRDAGQGTFWPGFAWSVAQEQTAATPDWMVELVLLVALVGLLALRRTDPTLAWYSLAIVGIPLVVVTLIRPLDLYARFFFYALPFLLTALAAGGAATIAFLARRLPRRLRPLAWAPVAIGGALLLRSWMVVFPDFLVDEGFRAGVQALEANRPDGTALCAIGAGAELFQWYATKPLPLPKTLNELQQVSRRASEVRCIARPASWESRSNAELRRYVEERSTAEAYGDVVVYRMHRGQ